MNEESIPLPIRLACRHFDNRPQPHCNNTSHTDNKACESPRCEWDLCPVWTVAKEYNKIVDWLNAKPVSAEKAE